MTPTAPKTSMSQKPKSASGSFSIVTTLTAGQITRPTLLRYIFSFALLNHISKLCAPMRAFAPGVSDWSFSTAPK